MTNRAAVVGCFVTLMAEAAPTPRSGAATSWVNEPGSVTLVPLTPPKTLCDDGPTAAKSSWIDACATSGYRAECPKMAFKFSILLSCCSSDTSARWLVPCIDESARRFPAL